MRGYGAQQIRDAEAPHLAAGEPLMARAAAALARECERMLVTEGVSLSHARVVVLVGGGNNGGDALYAAEALAKKGVTVELVRTSSRVHEEGLAAALAGGATVVAGPTARLATRAASSDLIVDGILGTGTSVDARLRGEAREVVAGIVAVRRSAAVVAVDIPSGIHPDTGHVPEPAAVLRADVTVTFGGCKAGLLLPPARDYAGDIRLIDIGLTVELDEQTPLIELDG
ncbi:NAD(P)H-hydrate epimerase [Gryllotalpicola reticulitermitis]|uniref:NAD(P)H-hydrate epimerase n=1 Tax=Gryllotalpicola reticulitermitis TaxID=1184153 RepID=A0ABV8Q6A8_9MICO